MLSIDQVITVAWNKGYEVGCFYPYGEESGWVTTITHSDPVEIKCSDGFLYAEEALKKFIDRLSAVFFLNSAGMPVNYEDADPEMDLKCPHCSENIRWYHASPSSLRWACNC